MKKILIIEDDVAIAELERDYLEASNFSVDICADGESGLQKALQNEYNLIVLDVMLPKMNGFEVLKKFRETKETPVLLVTARVTDIDKMNGFNAGADDYIVKPFSPLELTLRVEAHIKRFEKVSSLNLKNENKDIIEIDSLKINVYGRQVFKNDEEIFLANKEFELLLFLIENKGVVFTKEQILDRVWGEGAFVENSTVTVHINRLREKLEDSSEKPQLILTVWGKGYKFS